MNHLPSESLLAATEQYLLSHDIRDVHIICAFSGGADSVSLLWALHALQSRYGLAVSALHVNHGIRGEEAMRDEAFCHDFCLTRGISFYVERVDAPAYAREKHVSLETAARILRYEVFMRLQQQERALIATAHTAGDNAETVIFRMARGTGLTGLSGIPPMREGIIRPILTVLPETVRAALDELGLSHVEDSTNQDTAYTRNYIRAEVIPRLETLHPGAVTRIGEMTKALRQDSDFLEGEARKCLRETPPRELRYRMRELHPAVSTRMIRVLYEKVRKSPDALTAEQVESIERIVRGDSAHASIDLPCGVQAQVDGDTFFIRMKETPASIPNQTLHEGVNLLSGRSASLILSDVPLDIGSVPEMKIYNSVISVSFSTATIINNLYIRSRLPGDAYRYGGMTRKVKKLFCDAKLPTDVRRKLPLVCDEKGILWIPGFGVREDTKTSEQKQIYAYFGTQEDDK